MEAPEAKHPQTNEALLAEYGKAYRAWEKKQGGRVGDRDKTVALREAEARLTAVGLSHDDWLVFEAKKLPGNVEAFKNNGGLAPAAKAERKAAVAKELREQLFTGILALILGALTTAAGFFLIYDLGAYRTTIAIAIVGVALGVGGIYLIGDAIVEWREWRNSLLPEGQRKVKKKTYRSEYR